MSEKFGRFLQLLRRKKGLTQKDVALRVGIEPTYLSKVENDQEGNFTLSEESLTKLASVLGADSDEVLARAGKIPSDVRRMIVRDFSLIKEIRLRVSEEESQYESEEQDREPESSQQILYAASPRSGKSDRNPTEPDEDE